MKPHIYFENGYWRTREHPEPEWKKRPVGDRTLWSRTHLYTSWLNGRRDKPHAWPKGAGASPISDWLLILDWPETAKEMGGWK